jgi:hypothetical protein
MPRDLIAVFLLEIFYFNRVVITPIFGLSILWETYFSKSCLAPGSDTRAWRQTLNKEKLQRPTINTSSGKDNLMQSQNLQQ